MAPTSRKSGLGWYRTRSPNLVWSAAQHALGILSWATIALLLWRGRTPERIAAIAFLVVMTLSPVVAHLQTGGFRWAVALLSATLLALLYGLALTAERWWLLLATALQAVALATWVVTLVTPDTPVWAAVTVRLTVWLQLMAVSLFGIWEARSAPYAAPALVADRTSL